MQPILVQPASPPDGLEIRAARTTDIYAILALHREAFSDKFGAAFGRQTDRGVEAMAETWRRQGPTALRGMLLAVMDNQVVGTISMRTSDMGMDFGGTAELVFSNILGPWGAMRSIMTLSILEHQIGRYEGYITDVAVLSAYRRRGIAQALLSQAEANARQRQRQYMSLYVSKRNLGARSLYERYGFSAHRVRHSILAWLVLHQRDWVYMRKLL